MGRTDEDPRWKAFRRNDGYNRVSLVVPDPDSPTGWLCPGCGRNATIFFGREPTFDGKRYVGPDERLCGSCAA